VDGPPRPPALGRGRRRARGSRAVARGARRVRLDPDRALGARPARGARARLGRAHGARDRARPRPAGRGARGAAGRPDRRPPVHVRRGPDAERLPLLRLQGRGGDRRARRQHEGAAQGDRGGPAAAAARCAPRPRGARARPHALGQRGHHLAAERAPGQPEEPDVRRARTWPRS
jgi:hypothetical protein